MVKSVANNANASGNQNQRKDSAWKCGNQVATPREGEKKGYVHVECKFCKKIIKGGVKRLKDHLGGTHKNCAPCPKVPIEVKQEMLNFMKSFTHRKHMPQRNFEEKNSCPPSGCGSGTGSVSGASSRGIRGPMDRFLVNLEDGDVDATEKVCPVTAKELRNQVCLDIGRFFFENGIPFNAARSPSYFNMLRSVGSYGRGLKAPTMHEMRTWILKEEYNATTDFVGDIKATWKKTGVSILLDGWQDGRNRSLINFLVNNPHGTVFLRTIDASECIKDANLLFKLLDDVVEEIGEELVVQVVTDNASAYKAAGAKLMEKRKSLYWTPCAAHCIDLMLEKIGELPQHKNALLKAKKVSNFIYNHQWVLATMRKFAKREIIRPAATRFATAYLTLESLYQLKQPLQMMFVSQEWSSSAWAKKPEGKAVKKIIMNDNSFWPSVVYSIKSTKPLVQVLRLVNGETPAMGFIYGAMDAAKEEIAKNFDGQLSSYKAIWDIIDEKWDFQLHRHLHAAAYFLNPQFKWSPNCSDHPEITVGLYKVMDRLVKDEATYANIDRQLDDYKHKRGLLGFRAALASCKTRPPVDWWDQFGCEVPELKAFAMKILGLTCSSLACERYWSTFNQVHTKRRNRLSKDRMNSLVYIMYNRKLKDRRLRKKSYKEGDDPLVVETLPSDDEWVANPPNDDEEDEIRVLNVDDMIDIEDEGENSGRPKKRKRSRRSQASTKGKEIIPKDLDEEEFDYGDESDGEEDGPIRYDDDSSENPNSDDDNENEDFLQF